MKETDSVATDFVKLFHFSMSFEQNNHFATTCSPYYQVEKYKQYCTKHSALWHRINNSETLGRVMDHINK